MRGLYAIIGISVGGVMPAAGFAQIVQPPPEQRYVEVTGRLQNLFDYRPVEDPDNLLGNGWMTAKLRVERVLSGPRLPRVVTVRYFGHTYLRDGRRLRLTLRRDESGAYLICAPAGATGVKCP